MSRNDQSKRSFRMIGLSLFGALLAYQLVMAAVTGLADIFAAPTMVYLLDIKDRRLSLPTEQQEMVEANLTRALTLAPDNPDYLATLGWLRQLQMRQEQNALDSAQMARLETLAYQSYARASAQRPTWPYDWGDMAVEQFRQGNFGSVSYHRALVNAARFGPWQDDIQLLVADLGLETWNSLNLAAHQAVLMTINRGLLRQPDKMVAIIEEDSAWVTVCGTMPGGDEALPNLLAECQRR